MRKFAEHNLYWMTVVSVITLACSRVFKRVKSHAKRDFESHAKRDFESHAKRVFESHAKRVFESHAKRDFEHTYQNKRFSVRNKACVSCIVLVIKYVHICVTRHAKRAVLACCERAITFVTVFPWRVTFANPAVLIGVNSKL